MVVLSFYFMGHKFKDKRFKLFGNLYVVPAGLQLFLIIICIILCICIGLLINHREDIPSPIISDITCTTSAAIATANAFTAAPMPTQTSKNILVHISGAVKMPGLVIVKENSRLADVIDSAGGVMEDCDLSNVNLASFVTDGIKIHIPYIGQTPYYMESENTPSSQEVGDKHFVNNKKININTATMAELITLNGIGEATAKKIIAYREENGKFDKIEDILLVSGIGDAKFSIIKDNICV